MRYTVVESFSSFELVEKVEILAARGWRCQGGVALSYAADDLFPDRAAVVCYHQAMVSDIPDARPYGDSPVLSQAQERAITNIVLDTLKQAVAR